MAKVCSRCKASVEALDGGTCPACNEPFLEAVSPEIEKRAQEMLASIRAEIRAKAAKAAPGAESPAVVPPSPPPSPPPPPEPEVVPEVVEDSVVDRLALPSVAPAEPPNESETQAEEHKPKAPVAPPAPAPVEEGARENTAPLPPKEFRSERIILKPSKPHAPPPAPEPPPEPEAPPVDPASLPREIVPLPAFVPLIPGRPSASSPAAPASMAKRFSAPVRANPVRAALLFLLLAALGFGAWQQKLLPGFVEVTPATASSPSETASAAAASPDVSPVAAVASSSATVALASPAASSSASAPPSATPAAAMSPIAAASRASTPAPISVSPVPVEIVTPPPFDPRPALLAARAHFDKGEYDATVTALRALLEAHDDVADAHSMLGTTLAIQGDALGACEEYARYLDLAPKGSLAEQVRKAAEKCPQ